MNILPLPTDNLYKFMALSGVALLLFSIVYPFQRLQELGVRTIDSSIQMEIVSKRLDLLKFQVKAMEDDSATTTKEVVALKAKTTDLNIEALRGVGEGKKNAALLSQLHLFLGISLFTFIVGFLLAIFGFLLWYVRIQRPTDRQAASA